MGRRRIRRHRHPDRGYTTNWLARPLSISTSGAGTNWSTGTYKYDGAGNITKMGTDWFQYDPVSRLVRGVVHDGLMGGGNERQQTYAFDTSRLRSS